MNLNEANSILGVSPGISPEDAKKKYRELTRKYHPDINKEDGAEDRFKKINEAYQCIINGKGSDPEPPARSPFNPFQGISGFPGVHNPFGGRQGTRPPENISLNINVSFKESVLGCQKDISFSRQGKCQSCEGEGSIKSHNNCDKCGGKGLIVGRQGNMIFTRTCDKCMGQNATTSCDICSGVGSINTQVSGNVQIPGGVINGSILRLNGFGNYIGSFLGADQYSEAHLHIRVESIEGLRLENQDVVSELNISLLEALTGKKEKVNTISGEVEIGIPQMTRHKDEMKISNLGVNGIGFHRIIVNVNYPDDQEQIDNLINVLNGNGTFDPNDRDHLREDA
jgi:molecular chaperone DnaJ